MTIHAVQLAFLMLISCLVYHALREDDVRHAATIGMRRFGSFAVIVVVAGIALQWFTRWL
ncbi:MAG: hypothetical protein JNL94_13015 [Planctomycetes bacterium]|nr:hypothetical protein [Planctomycetota bacterium]